MATPSTTLERGETFNFTLVPSTNGEAETLDETWTCECYIQPSQGGTKVDLNPTLVDGVFTVAYDTSTLLCPSYIGDALFIDADGNRSQSTKFHLFINCTITPIS